MVVHFVIPEGTTSIDWDSWDGWGVDKETLEKVTIPISVESIGSRVPQPQGKRLRPGRMSRG